MASIPIVMNNKEAMEYLYDQNIQTRNDLKEAHKFLYERGDMDEEVHDMIIGIISNMTDEELEMTKTIISMKDLHRYMNYLAYLGTSKSAHFDHVNNRQLNQAQLEILQTERDWFFNSDNSEYFVSRLEVSNPSDIIMCSSTSQENDFESFWLSKEDMNYMSKEGSSFSDIPIPADLFFSKTLSLLDFEIHTNLDDQVVDVDTDKTYKDIGRSMTSVHRFCVEENYRAVVDGLLSPDQAGRKFHVATFYAHIIDNKTGQAAPKIIFPVFVEYGNDYLIAEKCAYSTEEKSRQILFVRDSIKDGEYAHLIHQEMMLFYGVELAMIHPVYKEIFESPRDDRIFDKSSKEKKKSKSKTRVVHKHFIKKSTFSDAKRKYEGFNRNTMVWHVSGHWRHYANDKKVFIQPYWKGPLRETKKNLDSTRIMKVDVPED